MMDVPASALPRIALALAKEHPIKAGILALAVAAVYSAVKGGRR